jgi:quercetin dioxygenase-like cupin family protein
MPLASKQLLTANIKRDSVPWIPFTPYSEEVEMKYFKLDPVQGKIVLGMRFPPGLQLPTHYHTGPVIGYTMKGAWRYLEHDWVAYCEQNGREPQDLTSFDE